MKLGAYDYVTKPFRVEELKLLLQRMAEKVNLVEEHEVLRDRVNPEMELSGISDLHTKSGNAGRIAHLKDTRTPVLITGESGTGKELVARAIHYRGLSPAALWRWIAAPGASFIENELFSSRKAIYRRNGLQGGAVPDRHGGTIFIDEIGELSTELQAKLLRVLREKEVRPVGINQKFKVDVR